MTGSTATTPVIAHTSTADRILAVLVERRRACADNDLDTDGVGNRRRVDGEPSAVPNYVRAQPQWIRILDHVLADEPVHFTLPAFPCKSPNLNKVAGTLPDEGERLALIALHTMCEEIRRVYAPGARVTICSDGHVFADAIGVPDSVVTDYSRSLREMITRAGLGTIGTFDLQDLWPGEDVPTKRARLISGWMESIEDLRAQAREAGEVARMLRGMTRFLKEDAGTSLTEDAGTQNALGTASAQQREAKRRAYQVLARSRAWGTLVGSRIPRAVRLSIHPQPWGASKFGIALIPELGGDGGWTTPWHSVVIYGPDGNPALARHDVARTLGRPEFRDGRVWCFRWPPQQDDRLS